MSCYSPLLRFVPGNVVNLNTGNPHGFILGAYMQYEGKVDMSDSRYQIVPCGQCIGCRIDRSRQWMVRIMHEAQLFEHNCFLTLTFDDDHLPTDGSLSVRDLQLFMKLLRKHNKGFEPVKDEKTGKITFPIRYFACGEYGSLNERPHYHLIIFNWQPDDMVLRGVNKYGNKLYTSPKIMQYWDKGFNTVGAVTVQSAGYVAKYCIKKVTGLAAEEHYRGRLPEFIVMSRRPGIAARWFDKYQDDIYNYDECILHGTKYRVPRYYDKLYDDVNPCKFAQVKANRLLKAQKFAGELLNSYRLSIKELKTKLYLEKRERNVVSC